MEIFPVSCSLLVEIYISAEQQLADLFTKCLPANKFKLAVSSIQRGMHSQSGIWECVPLKCCRGSRNSSLVRDDFEVRI